MTGFNLRFFYEEMCRRPDSIYIFFFEENSGVAAVETGGKQMSTGHLQLDGFSSAPSAKKQIPGSGICFWIRMKITKSACGRILSYRL